MDGDKSTIKVGNFPIAYNSSSLLPKEPDIQELKIFVDSLCETIILPIFGISVPFHISTVKNIFMSV